MGTAVATTAQDGARQIIAHAMKPYSKAMANVLPKHMTPERMMSLVLVAAVKTPKLLECTPESLALAVLRVAQWGLEIGSTAHIVPFFDRKSGKMVATPLAAWQGLVEMILRSPHVRDIWTTPVYAGEPFRVSAGVDPTIQHEPIFSDERRELTHVYAVAILRGNRSTFEVMSRGQVDRIRAAAPQPDSPGWKGHFDEMARKTVLRRLAKRLPQLPASVRDAVEVDDVETFRMTASATVASAEVLDAPALPRRLARGESGEYGNPSDEAFAAMGESLKAQAAVAGDPYDGAAGEPGLALGEAPAKRRTSPQERGQ